MKILGNLISLILGIFILGLGNILQPIISILFFSKYSWNIEQQPYSGLYACFWILFIFTPAHYYIRISILTFLQVIQTKEFENGDKYHGEIMNDEMHGKGTYYFENGEKYVGKFKNNKFHGKGKYTWSDGKFESGVWENDERIK